MKYILGLFLLLSIHSYSQTPSPYELKMDSISISHLNLSLEQFRQREFMLTLSPIKKVKVTLKTGFNNNILSKVNADATNITDAFQDVDTQDYISVLKYDIRLKIYLNKVTRLIFGTVINGVESSTNSYTMGLLMKF